jgi:hypothetical protein
MQVGDLVRFYESTHPEYNGIVIWRGRLNSPMETVKILMFDGSTQLRSPSSIVEVLSPAHKEVIHESR